MKKTLRLQFLKVLMLLVFGLFFNMANAQDVIGKQDFEVSPGTPVMAFATSDIGSPGSSTGFSTGNSGSTAAPSNSNLFSEGSRGYRFQGPASGSLTAGRVLTFSSINTSGYSDIAFSIRVAGMSIGTAGNGLENTVDEVLIEVSPDGGSTWYQQAKVNVQGTGSNARWAFSGTGVGTRDYLSNNSFSSFSVTNNNASGATITGTSAITTAKITNLPSVANLVIRVSAQTNSSNESWIIDDIQVTGTVISSAPTISIDPVSLVGFGNVNLGNYSSSQQLSVSGSNLTENINVTVPSSNFQVSLDGTTGWGASVSIPFGSGTITNIPLYVRFSPQSSGLKSGDILITSNGATQKTVSVSGTGVFPSPVANNATLITSEGFTANWSLVSGATSYELDIYSIATGANATNLIISEYGEGSVGNRKYIEIFNGTGSTVDLSNYRIWNIANGGSWPESSLDLSGTLLDGHTYTIGNNSTDVPGADLYNGGITNFNGDDAMGLAWNGGSGTTFSLIDAVGQDGADPGSGWSIAGIANATVDKILIRKSSVGSPNTNWSVSAGTNAENSEWIVSDFTYSNSSQTTNLGLHTYEGGTENVYVIQNQNVGNVTSYAVSGLTQGTTYHYVVRAILGSDISQNSNIIDVSTVATSTTWENGAWSNGTPSASLDAIITQNYSTGAVSPQGPFTAKSLTVNSGTFTVASGTSVTIENAIVNNAGSNNFIVENNANLIQTNAVANTGAIKVRRNSNPLYRYDYTLWSSPVIGQNLKAFSSGTLSNRFYLYNTATNTNGEYETVFPAQNEATYNFAAGSGYLIRTSDSHPVYVEGNSGTAINAEFTGVPYNQALNVTLSSANTGFNLVGNPYTSAISISQLFSQNSNAIDGTIWFWRKRNGATGSGYATSTGLGVTSLHPEATAINTNGVIGAGQGFFVKVKAGATQNTLNFSNILRSTNTGGSFFRSADVVANSQDVERHRIWLNLSNGTEVVGQTLLGYMTGATSGVDYGIEGKYFNDSPVAFTSYVENQEFAIQGRSLPFVASDIVPMAFKTDVAGSYSIAIDHVDGLFAEDQNIYLKDNFTGQLHDIKSSSYAFSSESGIFNNRFEVVYQSQLSVDVPQISTNSIVVYKQNGNLVVNAGNYVMSKIELYDVSGRLVYTKNNIDASATVISNLSIANQVLVVKITTAENGTANKKIVY